MVCRSIDRCSAVPGDCRSRRAPPSQGRGRAFAPSRRRRPPRGSPRRPRRPHRGSASRSPRTRPCSLRTSLHAREDACGVPTSSTATPRPLESELVHTRIGEARHCLPVYMVVRGWRGPPTGNGTHACVATCTPCDQPFADSSEILALVYLRTAAAVSPAHVVVSTFRVCRMLTAHGVVLTTVRSTCTILLPVRARDQEPAGVRAHTFSPSGHGTRRAGPGGGGRRRRRKEAARKTPGGVLSWQLEVHACCAHMRIYRLGEDQAALPHFVSPSPMAILQLLLLALGVGVSAQYGPDFGKCTCKTFCDVRRRNTTTDRAPPRLLCLCFPS